MTSRRRGKTPAERAKERADRVREIAYLQAQSNGLGYLDGKRRHLFLADVPAPGDPPAPRAS